MCSCAEYEDLEFLRKVISKRIRESRALRKQFELIATHNGKEHKLYRCEACGQLWQGSRAWNWGNDEYLFKVPEIEIEEWLSEVFVQPDEMLIFTAVVGEFWNNNAFVEKESNCTTNGCTRKAITGSVKCLSHHLQSLQKVGAMPACPVGRWFGPYRKENVLPPL